jgi:transposase-like protein
MLVPTLPSKGLGFAGQSSTQNQLAERSLEQFEFTICLFEDNEFEILKEQLTKLAKKTDNSHLRNIETQFKQLTMFSLEHPKFSVRCGIIVISNYAVYNSTILQTLFDKSKSAVNKFLSKIMGNAFQIDARTHFISLYVPQILNGTHRQWIVRPFIVHKSHNFLSILDNVGPTVADNTIIYQFDAIPTGNQFAVYLQFHNFDTFYDSFRNLRDLNDLNFTDDQTIAFLAQNHIIPTSQECNCGSSKEMLLQNCDASALGKRWYCSDCKSTKSIFEDSFFYGFNICLKDVLSVAYCFAQDFSIKQIIDECRICRDTVIKIIHRLQLCMIAKQAKERQKIGGALQMVQMDETFISKRKFNKGRKLCQFWIIGGIDCLTKKIFLEWNILRTTAILCNIIERNVEVGSVIVTDRWPAYHFLFTDVNYWHEVVNHSLHFVDPETGVNTQMIERLWLEVKEMKHRRRGFYTDRLDELLAEFTWRRNELSVAPNKIQAIVHVMGFYMK